MRLLVFTRTGAFSLFFVLCKLPMNAVRTDQLRDCVCIWCCRSGYSVKLVLERDRARRGARGLVADAGPPAPDWSRVWRPQTRGEHAAPSTPGRWADMTHDILLSADLKLIRCPGSVPLKIELL
jgi:hypothetical protein